MPSEPQEDSGPLHSLSNASQLADIVLVSVLVWPEETANAILYFKHN